MYLQFSTLARKQIIIMSSIKMNRRMLLKSSLFTASGLSLLPSLAFTKPLVSLDEAKLRSAMIPCAEQTEPEFFKPGKPEVKARLLANENPFGPSPKAKKALSEAIDKSFMYPGKSMMELVEMIAKAEGVTKDHILLGAGSSQILMSAFLAFNPKGKFVVADPGYISNVKELNLEKVKLTKDYKHDLSAMAAKVSNETSMAYICNPNNPTGTEVDTKELKDFCETVSPKIPVMVDEAYIDYVANPKESSMMECVRKGQNVIVVRTFSKLHAFAGLRIGYCVAQPETIKTLQKYHVFNTLAMTSLHGAIASYQDTEFPKMVLSKTQEAKDFLYKTLKAYDFDYVPSVTNFVLFPLRMKGKTFLDKMSDEGVRVRRWEFDRQHWCRVSLGKMEDMKTFAEAFAKVVA